MGVRHYRCSGWLGHIKDEADHRIPQSHYSVVISTALKNSRSQKVGPAPSPSPPTSIQIQEGTPSIIHPISTFPTFLATVLTVAHISCPFISLLNLVWVVGQNPYIVVRRSGMLPQTGRRRPDQGIRSHGQHSLFSA